MMLITTSTVATSLGVKLNGFESKMNAAKYVKKICTDAAYARALELECGDGGGGGDERIE